jgi:Helicase conserved C-terminal domain/SNF2-related domain
MSFSVGSLVKARGREWVVLPPSTDDLLVLRPLGGTEDEVAGIYLPLEPVHSATFDLPDPDRPGDYRSSRLLRDAVRLGFRSSAGPFRSFARLGVEPRPYQLVPLLMALKLDPVRILISDDVGIGKTVEAGLIARELLDRGEVERMAVLCPPHLAEQWQAELREKFHLEAELVLPGTVPRLERNKRFDESVFERYPFLIVSTDFIKSDRRRFEFLRTCPELVIVDEAHTCAWGGEGRGNHQRHQLVRQLAENPSRNLVLVTATPHSGNEEAFRSLLSLLDRSFSNLPEDLSGAENEAHRRRLAAHFVQRRRADIRHYMDADTPFPERVEAEEAYQLSPGYRRLFDRVLGYARETVRDADGGAHRSRVRWWAALSLLRALASSPAAAAATLRSRAAAADTDTVEEADEVGRRAVLDLLEDEAAEGVDVAPGADTGEGGDDEGSTRRRLREMAREADALRGEGDAKLQKAVQMVRKLVADGFRPIVFCRFIPTAEYVAEALRGALRGVEVAAVTGTLPLAEREERVLALEGAEKRVLVCTDCLSEGVNLQDLFDAVLHYDLSWNPTRHEQREGRVDRFGQRRPAVRVVTYYGTDNQIDGIVLDVLLRKHRLIRGSLGISVPVPVDTDRVVEAIFEGLLLRGQAGGAAEQLAFFEEHFRPQKEELFREWEAVSARERRSRTVFAQETLKPDEVACELAAVREAIGAGVEVEAFTSEVLRAAGAAVRQDDGRLAVDLAEAPTGLREAVGGAATFRARFARPVGERELYLTRTHPVVEGLATWVMDTALDPRGEGVARRAGAIRTRAVERRTTVLLLRLRYHIVVTRGEAERALLAEDTRLVAFAGAPGGPQWLPAGAAEALLAAAPDANVTRDQAAEYIRQVIDGFDAIRPRLDEVARERGDELLDAHRRVRAAAAQKGVRYRVEPQLPPDVLGIYVYMPA